jgi:hypothetical protein
MNIQTELRNQRAALQLLGVSFCSICGKPHIVEEHFISLTRRTSCGNVSIPVCLDGHDTEQAIA